ncbi:MAG TPA: pyridoxal-phosphate dependent enzyme [candidate division Zixibacteria bacterium]|nr:pyridoxal-phosphate dependent enzyme [candidate division Zixibacteria bacterium]
MAPRQPLVRDVVAARHRLRGIALHTPLEPSPRLTEEAEAADVRLKLDMLQPTGAFKIRGAFNKVALVAAEQPDAELVTASTGNHGIAVATAAAAHGMRLTVLVGASITAAKLERLRAFESDRCVVEVFGRSPEDAEAEARTRANAGRAIYVSPYNDPDVIAGQGTLAAEVLDDWPACDAMVVPVGGGGLISGIGLYAKAVRPDLRLVGVQPSASPPVYAYLQSGSTRPMPIAPTLADAVAGNNQRDSITWRLVRQLVDEVVLVDEAQIGQAMAWLADTHRLMVEGSGALAVAALRAGLGGLAGRRVTAVLSGRNVDAGTFQQVLATYLHA